MKMFWQINLRFELGGFAVALQEQGLVFKVQAHILAGHAGISAKSNK